MVIVNDVPSKQIIRQTYRFNIIDENNIIFIMITVFLNYSANIVIVCCILANKI